MKPGPALVAAARQWPIVVHAVSSVCLAVLRPLYVRLRWARLRLHRRLQERRGDA